MYPGKEPKESVILQFCPAIKSKPIKIIITRPPILSEQKLIRQTEDFFFLIFSIYKFLY